MTASTNKGLGKMRFKICMAKLLLSQGVHGRKKKLYIYIYIYYYNLNKKLMAKFKVFV